MEGRNFFPPVSNSLPENSPFSIISRRNEVAIGGNGSIVGEEGSMCVRMCVCVWVSS